MPDVKARLSYYVHEHGVEKAKGLISLLKPSSCSQIVIPEKCHYFCFVIVDLIGKKKGSIICKQCHKTYGSFDLKELPLGHGKTPFDIRIPVEKGFLKRLLKSSMPIVKSGLGGVRYLCPEGHELISISERGSSIASELRFLSSNCR
ncbi:MAG: hypothetical protein ACMUHX_03510 [bacterium]